MKKTYRLARTWQYLLHGCYVGFLLIILIVVLTGSASLKDMGSIWVVIIFAAMAGLSYGTASSKIITSTDGIETVSFGVRVKSGWNQVERVDINGFGFVNIVFRDSIYKSRLLNSILKPLTYDRTIQLSPYIEDMGTSGLLKDIACFVPNVNIPEFVSTHQKNTKPYQKVGRIGLYYLGWMILSMVIAYVLRYAADRFEGMGLGNSDLVSIIATYSLLFGLLLNGLGLLDYNARIANLNEKEISHIARAYYYVPITSLLVGFLVGIGGWLLLKITPISLPKDNYGIQTFIAIFVSASSLRISSWVDNLIFRTGFRLDPNS